MNKYSSSHPGLAFRQPPQVLLGQSERVVLTEQGVPEPAARTIARNDVGLWIYTSVVLLLVLGAFVWLIVIQVRQSDMWKREKHECKRGHVTILNLTEIDTVLEPNSTDAGNLSTVQAVAGFLYNSQGTLVGNTTGACTTSDAYYIDGTLFYTQTCTQVYNFFRNPPANTEYDSIITMGQYFSNTDDAPVPADLWSVTGGDGKFFGAYGIEYGTTVGSGDTGYYADNFDFYVPCENEEHHHHHHRHNHHHGG
jgi:hypothetical protein